MLQLTKGVNMAEKFNQMKYINEFNRKNYKNYYFRVRRDNKEVIEWMDKQPNKTEYLMNLVRRDMEKK